MKTFSSRSSQGDPVVRYFSEPATVYRVKQILHLLDLGDESHFTLIESEHPRASELISFDRLAEIILERRSCDDASLTFYDTKPEGLWWTANRRWTFDWNQKVLEAAPLGDDTTSPSAD